MLRFKFLVFFMGWVSLLCNAQYYKLNDTLEIDEVSISAKSALKYQAGAKSVDFDTLQMLLTEGQNLETLITRLTPIYVKSNAGGVSTIRFRGLTPDHTSIKFGGLNINSLTLGHSNIANVPMYLFDNPTLQFGSASAINGSGAIGGSIFLEGDASFGRGFSKELRLGTGSFGELLTGTKISFSKQNFVSKTSFSFFTKKNNFPFTYRYKDFTTQDFVENVYKQRFANIKNHDVLQQFEIKTSRNSFVSSKIWYQQSWHQIQLNIASHSNKFVQPEELMDRSLRWWSQFNYHAPALKFHVGTGAVWDYQLYKKDVDQIIETKRIVTDAGIEKKFRINAGVNAGNIFKLIVPEVYAYPDSVIKQELHNDLYLSFYHSIFNRIKYTLNLRKPYISDYHAPFTPAVGVDVIVINRAKSCVKVQGNISRTYRVPSFNDRFWIQAGNPNLKPESGMHYELGTTHFSNYKKFNSKLSVHAFIMKVDNWIEWKPGGIGWIPENDSITVVSKGVEFMGKMEYLSGDFMYKLGANYTINPVYTENRRDYHILVRQHDYVPLHMANSWFSLSWKLFTFCLDTKYTGIRNTNETGDYLNDYLLTNLSFLANTSIKGQKFKLIFEVCNVFDVTYQNQAGYAMPGINYKFSIVYN